MIIHSQVVSFLMGLLQTKVSIHLMLEIQLYILYVYIYTLIVYIYVCIE